jgi:hypothetical protein
MAELYNDRLGDGERPKRQRKTARVTPINVQGLRLAAAAEAAGGVRELVMQAKTEALLMMGERRQAFVLMDESLA